MVLDASGLCRRCWLVSLLCFAVATCFSSSAQGQVVRLPTPLPDSVEYYPGASPAEWYATDRADDEHVNGSQDHDEARAYGSVRSWTRSEAPADSAPPWQEAGVAPTAMHALAADPQEPTLDFNQPFEAPVDTLESRPPGVKAGPLQQVRLTNTWLASGGASGLGMYDVGLQATIAFPFFTRESPMILTPGFGAHFLDGPEITDLPSRVYDAFLEIRWLRPITHWLTADLAVTPGVYSDFQANTGEEFRLTGRGLALIDSNPVTKWVLGVAYVNRTNVRLLPVAGVIWTPADFAKIELIMPQPRIALKLNPCGTGEWWGYVGGEFGGGMWAIERDFGAPDRVTYNDLRLLVGIEKRNYVGSSLRAEVGYVFDRKLIYDSDPTKIRLDDTVSLRVVAAY